jgi:hypothetical protein
MNILLMNILLMNILLIIHPMATQLILSAVATKDCEEKF